MKSTQMKLTHVDKTGAARMVDVSVKPKVRRIAIAGGTIHLKPDTVRQVKKGLLKKGDVLACARIAGIAGGKRTADLIPLCHNIFIDQLGLDFVVHRDSIDIEATAICVDKTGIEMEVLTAVSIAALTIYDMCKAVDKEMKISNIHLVEKRKEPV